MTDYSKLKVTELKEELKGRKIPLSGLKVKKDFIEKLLAADAADEASSRLKILNAVGDEVASTIDLGAKDVERPVVTTEAARQSQTDESPNGQQMKDRVQDTEVALNINTVHVIEKDRSNENDAVNEKSQAPLATDLQDTVTKAPLAASLSSSVQGQTNETDLQPVVHSANPSEECTIQPVHQSTSLPHLDDLNTPQTHSAQPSSTGSTSPGPATLTERLEDSRKRKRRSATPPPSSFETAQKKVKASDGSPRVGQKEASILAGASQPSNDTETSTNDQELEQRAPEKPPPIEDRSHSDPQFEPTGPPQKPERSSRSRSPMLIAPSQPKDDQPVEHRHEEQDAAPKSPVSLKPHSPNLPKRRSPPSPKPVDAIEGRLVSPALHPATCSLYIRNFKRPLHIPSLRSHISKLAASPNTDAGHDPIASFYLDSVRTHAFVSFTSVTAASRVRSALHDSRFPDEKTREPLWIDFVPDEKTETWIETEQQANGGGRIGRRWEVVYQDGPGGIEANLQEVGTGPGSRPAPQGRPSGLSGKRDPEIAPVRPTISGVHPDRAGLVPSEEDMPRRRERSVGREQRPEQTGTGFRALDDLFPSTTAKPKLYYKPVDGDIAEERLEMMAGLRNVVGAKSGDPDMRRYSFEVDRGREEWVDKGPEFGYGARGRAVERGGRGGYRGRGVPGRGGDTWRSSGRY